MGGPGSTGVRLETSRVARVVLLINAALAASAGAVLTAVPHRTDELFAFEIEPPLTGAWMGALFLAGAVMQGMASFQRRWRDAAVAVVGVLVYDLAILGSLLLGLESFPLERPAAMAWLAIYILSPMSLGAVMWVQGRVPRAVGGRSGPLAGTLLALGCVSLLAGLALLVAPASVSTLWAWRLIPERGSYDGDPTIARYVGAWLLGIGVTIGHVGLARPGRATRPVFIAGVIATALALLAIARERDDIPWSGPAAWVLVAAHVLAGAVSVVCLRAGLTGSRREG